VQRIINPKSWLRESIKPIALALPRREIKCISFLASAALVGAMLDRGVDVRRHPLRPDALVAPSEQISNSQLIELLDRRDFVFLSTVVFLSVASSSPWTVDGTWNNASNMIEVIGGGGSGGSAQGTTASSGGGGGGAYCSISNASLSGTAAFGVGAGGTGVTGTPFNGNNGGQTWFNSVAYPVSGPNTVGADKGLLGQGLATNSATGGAGGLKANNFPANTGAAGGKGGNCSANNTAAGGGGAGGPHGDGVAAANVSTQGTGSAGGNGDAGSGGAGSATSTTSANGGAGTEYTTAGSGGGSGAGRNTSGTSSSGTGGLYGAGSGGSQSGISGTPTSGAGAPGLIVLTWTPAGIPQQYISIQQAITRSRYW
jgi:hypothetical protein